MESQLLLASLATLIANKGLLNSLARNSLTKELGSNRLWIWLPSSVWVMMFKFVLISWQWAMMNQRIIVERTRVHIFYIESCRWVKKLIIRACLTHCEIIFFELLVYKWVKWLLAILKKLFSLCFHIQYILFILIYFSLAVLFVSIKYKYELTYI